MRSSRSSTRTDEPARPGPRSERSAIELDRVAARPAVQRGVALRVEEAGKVDIAKDKEAWKLLFTQGARG